MELIHKEEMMKKKAIVIIGIGCVSVICLIILIFIITMIPEIQKDIKKEFSPSNIIPDVAATKEKSESTQVSLNNQLTELSYIQILTLGYTDDADPENEGISIDISFYNENSKSIDFSDIPILVQIELYGYRDIMDTFKIDRRELIYQGTVDVDHSMRLGELFGNYIHIPFEEINIDRNAFVEFGTIAITVNTPAGVFLDTEDMVPLY